MRAIFWLIVTFVFMIAIAPVALSQEQLAVVPANINAVSDTYPHIGALENAILGQNFPGQPITQRLERMEKKAFGSVSLKTDLSERTDALDDYTANTLHKNLLQANVDVDATDSANAQLGQYPPVSVPSSGSDYPRVTELEQAILGQTYAGQPLADRLSRMEIKAFGSASINSDLSVRTDTLENYAETKLHKPPSGHPDSEITEENPKGQGGGLLSKVGQAIFGMAAGSGPGGILGNGPMGMGAPFGGMNSGFGGVRVGRRPAAQQEQKEAEPPIPVHPEDPAVYQVAPPEAEAKLIVKVGWCEVKVFGHTFPNMHLPERLAQINNELKLEPGKSNIQLMDDIGLMIKTIQARKLSAPMVPASITTKLGG